MNKEESYVDENSMVQNVVTNPGTQCKEGYTVLYNISESAYRCVSESTAEKWLDDGTGEIHDLLQYILAKDQYKTVLDEAYEINQEITALNDEYSRKQAQLESVYDDILKDAKNSAKRAERNLLDEYHTSETMTSEEIRLKITAARNHSESIKEKILQEKSDGITTIELELKEKLLDIVKRYEDDSDIKVMWNTDTSTYEAVPRR
jgi:hypothetical protein